MSVQHAERNVTTEAELAALREELQRARDQADEALRQQIASAEILRAISESPADSQPVLDAIVRTGLTLFAGAAVSVALVDGDIVRAAAVAASDADSARAWRDRFPLPLTREYMHAVAILDRRIVDVPDVRQGPAEWSTGTKNFLASGYLAVTIVPLVHGDTAIGALSVVRRQPGPLTQKQLAALRTFTDQALIAIRNAQLFNEIQESLQQQTASSEVLRVISSSIGDTAPVFDKIMESCERLFAGRIVGLNLVDADGLIRMGVYHGPGRKGLEQIYPLPLEPSSGSAIAILERRVVHYPDVDAADVPHATRTGCNAIGIKSVLFAPLLWEGRGIGAIFVGRDQVRPFSEKEMTLLKTFADQAAIGIENARLFRRLEQRNRDVSDALEQQTATAEILRVTSGSPTSTAPVFRAILASSVRLCEADMGLVLRYDDGVYQTIATLVPDPAFDAYLHEPINAGPLTGLGRVASSMAPVHIPDLIEDPAYAARDPLRMRSVELGGVRTWLGVPMVREGELIGAIAIYRKEVRPFEPRQVEVLRTFADQAVIAIENVRLFNETKEALERQTATAEILRVTSSSPTDLQPVFAAVAANAARLCDAPDVVILTVDGDSMRFATSIGPFGRFVGSDLVIPISRGWVAGRAVVDRTTVHVHDLAAESENEYSVGKELQRRYGHHTMVATPLLRGDVALGVIAVLRKEVRPFNEQQLRLLHTFADQAVIAIENVRLFKETKEALERQTATAEVLRVISGSPTDVQPVLDAVAERAGILCRAEGSRVWLAHGGQLHAMTRYGPAYPESTGEKLPIRRTSVGGRALLERQCVHVEDIVPLLDSEYPDARALQARHGFRTVLVVPMLRDGQPVGIISLLRNQVRPFAPAEIGLVQTFADQAVIAIENVRLFNETKEALDQQRASSEVLTAISNSISDAKPVFEVILQSCQRLFASETVGMTLVRDDGMLEIGAYAGPGEAELRGVFPRPLDRMTSSGRAILDQRVQVYADVDAGEMPEASRRGAHAISLQSMAFAPMNHGGRGIGTLWIGRAAKGPFTDKQLALLATFADQAVIAIQNAHLFSETQEALQTQTATADVLKVISESPTDVQPVFDAIAERAKVLCNAIVSGVARLDGEMVHLVAYHGISAAADQAMRSAFPMRIGSESISARAIRDRVPVQIPDVNTDPTYALQHAARLAGYRSNLAVPMLKEGQVVGSIVVCRAEPGFFPDNQIKLLQTFADQAVIAIENVRLFNELREKGAQLELASRHKSEFLANMSHELRTPLNAIIGFTRIVMRRSREALESKQYENLEKILQSGQNLLALINSILDLAKVEAGRVEVHPDEVELMQSLEGCVRTIEPLLGSNVKLVRVFHCAELLLFVDGEKLRQIVINLLSNAAKFTTQGSIRVATSQDGARFAISVVDTGIGIASDKLETIFEEFEQAGATDNIAQRGTGLGLTIARRLARLMGGDITVTSTPGAGSTFTLALPLRYGSDAG